MPLVLTQVFVLGLCFILHMIQVIGGKWGDCDELRLFSGSTNNTIISLRAHGGILNFRFTKVLVRLNA